MRSEILFVILGAALMTYLTRFPLLILAGKREIPAWLTKFMSYIAPSILTALLVPVIFIKQGELDMSLSNEYIAAAVITAAVAYFTKNMLASVITGVCSVALLMFLIK